MSSGFATARCLHCGSYTEGGQFCADCVERQRAEEKARAERVAQSVADRPAAASSSSPAGSLCPSCGRFASPDAKFCGYCRYQFRAYQPGAGELAYAGFWIRFLAWFIDGVILGGVNVVISLGVANPFSAFVLEIILGAIYHIAFWIGQGATPGKMAVGVKVVMANGEPIEFGAAVLRYFGYWLSGLILGIGYLMIAFSAEKRGLHDNIAGTVVIKTR
ncbi:MAG: RDD family protein [Chloroflexi bacterium]|jgi:uncharacterized RDD family membrane protein YckC|nr:MAG: RDD family protein [Chloroflexota bacterium]